MFRILSIMLTSQVPKHFIVFIMQHILSSWWLPSFIITVITCYLSLLAHFTKSPVIRPLSTFKSEELKRLTVCLCIFQGKDGLGIFCHGNGFLFFLGWSAVKLAFLKCTVQGYSSYLEYLQGCITTTVMEFQSILIPNPPLLLTAT